MKKKLGLLAGVLTLASALLPLAGSPAGAVDTVTSINSQVTVPAGGYYTCFGRRATITDARKTSTMEYVVVGYDENDDSIMAWQKVYGGPKNMNRGAHHTGTFNVYYGTPGDDVIIGTGKMDYIIGNGGHDRICALDGNDIVEVGGSSDTPGWVQVDGGRGDDYLSGAPVTNAGMSFRAYGGPGNDILEGGNFNDYLDGGRDRNMLYGGPGWTNWPSSPAPGAPRWDQDTCLSGATTQFYFDDTDANHMQATTDYYDNLRRDNVAGVDYNCETVKPGRGWTNHAHLIAPTTVTTTYSAPTTTSLSTTPPPAPPVTTTTR